MKRKDFISFALLLAASRHIPLGASQDETFRIDFSSFSDLLKKVPDAERNTASLMIRNLLFDVEHIFNNASNKSDLATIKRLAEEADRKFYKENNLKADSFQYKPIDITELEAIERNSSLKPGEFDTMLKTIKSYASRLKQSQEKFETLIPRLLREADLAAQKLKEAEEKAGCSKVMGIIAAVVLVVVAVVVAAVTFGAGATLIALAVIAAAAIIGGAATGANAGQITGATIGTSILMLIVGGSVMVNEKVNFSWSGFDKKLKCIFFSSVTAITGSVYSQRSYPAQPIMGSLAVNIFGITHNLAGIKRDC